ncbi:MAG: TonB-dependent receptor, partial [Gemmatimonadetes bacterium]|nr:TonB-dependent receptor [Gemmatimonadota bacterium]
MVRDKATGQPIAYADIVLQGSGRGGITQSNGTFQIPGVPAGTYTLMVNRVGYSSEKIENVVIGAGQVVSRTIQLELNEQTTSRVVIEEDIDEIDVKESGTNYKIGKEEFKIRAVNNVTDALSKQPGVIVDPNGGVHVRGARTDETKYQVDGMPVTSSFNANQSLQVSFAALSEIELLSGGFDAEYG